MERPTGLWPAPGTGWQKRWTLSVTLRDIAQSAHVSISTVSRVLNDYPYVSEATRQAVCQAAQALGYPPGKSQGTLLSARSVLLINCHPDWQHEQGVGVLAVDRRLVFGIQSVLEPQNVPTRVQSVGMEPEKAQQFADDPDISGLILLGGIVNQDFVLNLQAAGLPFVVAGARVRSLHVNCVTADYAHGAQEATAHLIARGRRQIGLVNGPPTTTSSAAKYEGFRLALALHGLGFSPSWVVVSEEFATEPGYRQTLRLLEQAPDLDAIVYAGDRMAVGGLRAIKESGRRVPDDVAITGFYDDEIAPFADPPLTSVRVDMHMMGRIAARRLLMLLEGTDEDAWCVTIPASLVVRKSA